jgi:hypothetical protein
MAVPSTFADLSATPASNSGLISDSSAVNTIDDHFRTIYAFIASVYANSGNGWASPFLPAANPSYTGTLTGGTGVVNLGSGQVYKDAGGNLGLGTTVPGSKLDVAGEIRITDPGANANVRFMPGGVERGKLTVTNASSMIFETAGAERLLIDSSGNQISTPSNTPPTLTVNGQMNLTPTSNTNMRISYRGSDGVTRVGDITLA